MDRRTLLVAGAGSLGTLAGCLGGGGTAEYGDWFDGVDNYDGELDRTGREVVPVRVGADDGFAFDPAAIIVDAGTTVRWTWTGRGGRHNVVAEDGPFESPFYSAEAKTWEHAFDDAGLFPYFCEPHRAAGMKGGVRVE